MALKTVQLQLYIYEGTSGSYTNSDLKYTLQKSIISYQDNIVFEIAEIVRDYIDVNFNDEYLSKTIWVTTVANLVDDTDTIFTYGSPVTNTSLAFDGYGFYEDEINPQLTEQALKTKQAHPDMVHKIELTHKIEDHKTELVYRRDLAVIILLIILQSNLTIRFKMVKIIIELMQDYKFQFNFCPLVIIYIYCF